MLRNKKRWIKAVMGALIGCLALSVSQLHGTCEGVRDSVVRLHILANSDSEEDQALKLKVRDAVLAASEDWQETAANAEEALVLAESRLPEIEAVATAALADAGAPNTVSVTLGEETYPTREYEQLAFPAGEYLSLRVLIGAAEGQNWWCVLFPPLCLTTATERRESEAICLSAGLTGEQYRLIADTGETKYRLRFKILEVAENLLG